MRPFKSPTFGMRHIHLSLFQEHYVISYGVESSLSNTQIFYSQNSVTLRGSREKLGLSALQKVNKNPNVFWGLDGWGRWPKNLGHSISKSFFSLLTLWVITESFCCKLFDINSLAWDQILMDEIQILKKIIVWVELFLAVIARIAHAKKLLPTLRWRSLSERGERPMKWAISV